MPEDENDPPPDEFDEISAEIDDEVEYDEESNESGNESYFLTPRSEHRCDTCNQAFKSKNKLFQHIRESQHKVPQKARKEVKTSTPAGTPKTNVGTPKNDAQTPRNSTGPPKNGIRTPRDNAAETKTPQKVSTETSRDKVLTATDLKGSVPIITSSANNEIDATQGYAFRGFTYATISARLTPAGKDFRLCADPGSPISFVDKGFLLAQNPSLRTQIRQLSAIPVTGFGNKTLHSTEYIVLNLFIPGKVENGPALAEVKGEFHLTTGLEANMLLGTDILTPH